MSRKADLGNTATAMSGVKGVPPGYEVLRSCGEGTFGQVFLCKSDTGKHVAIKTIKQEGSKQETEGVPLATIREASLLKELWHPNILHLESVYVNNSSTDFALSLVFEFVDHDLHEIMQVLRGLEYLHTNWIIHRDMKPSNILVTGMADSNPGQVRIADFGLARVYRSPSRPLYENGVVVTIWYRAPELLLGATHYTPAVDMWAAGCIFGELLTLKPMFPGSEVRDPLDAFQQNQLHRIMSIMGHINDESWPGIANTLHWKRNTQDIRSPRPEYQERLEQHLLQSNPNLKTDPRLLQYHPGKRLTAQEALNHPYFKHEPLPGMNCYPQGYNLRMPAKLAREGQKKKVTAGATNATGGTGAAGSARLTQGAVAARAANGVTSGKAKASNLSKTATQGVKKVVKKPGIPKKAKPSK